jgi:hypothetical protein
MRAVASIGARDGFGCGHGCSKRKGAATAALLRNILASISILLKREKVICIRRAVFGFWNELEEIFDLRA